MELYEAQAKLPSPYSLSLSLSLSLASHGQTQEKSQQPGMNLPVNSNIASSPTGIASLPDNTVVKLVNLSMCYPSIKKIVGVAHLPTYVQAWQRNLET